MKTLRTAVVGLGRIGWQYHLPQIAAHDGFTPVAAVDTDPARLAEARDAYGINGYADIAEMLSGEKPDLTVVCTPTPFHRAHACAAMEAGSDVFLDKPMAPSLSDAKTIADCAQSTGRRLMVYQPHRAVAEAAVIRRILNTGLLGTPVRFRRASTSFVRRRDWQAVQALGGGMIGNYGAHYIDQMLYLSGGKPERVFCSCLKAVSLGDAEDVVKIVMETASGCMIDIDISQASSLPAVPFEITGTLGTLQSVPDTDGKPGFRVRYLDPAEVPPAELDTRFQAKDRKYSLDGGLVWHEKFFPVAPEDAVDFYGKCYEYYALGTAPFVPIEETLTVMETMDRCRSDATFFRKQV